MSLFVCPTTQDPIEIAACTLGTSEIFVCIIGMVERLISTLTSKSDSDRVTRKPSAIHLATFPETPEVKATSSFPTSIKSYFGRF